MSSVILPVIGSSGFYTLAAPFDVEVVAKIEYTCMAIRRISEFTANNVDVREDIYTPRNISEAVWREDSESDAYIVSLRSRTGHWLYVPARYILNYPSVNGIQYRSLMLGISLPSLPISQDVTALLAELKDMAESSLGVTVAVKQVETSKVVLVDHETHVAKQQARTAASQGLTTMRAKNVKLTQENAALLARLAELENYIATHYVP